MVLGGAMLMALSCLHAQDARSADEMVQTAVKTELAADHADHSLWRYRDERKEADDSVSIVVQTKYGSVSRLISKGGQPLSEAAAQAEDRRVQNFIHDQVKLAKQKKDGAQDDKNATELLNMLPEAFTWAVQSEDAKDITLHFKHNPNFNPPDMQSRVMSTMEGELVVDRKQNRIAIISGRLTQDVLIGWGILGRLRAGGTFRVERRELSPGVWQITDTHVNIQGKALFFKSIGEQQDEVESDFTRVSPDTTLEQAAEMSKSLK